MLFQVSASLLSANFAAFGDEVRALTGAGADRIHFDIMDGHFVSNLTFGAEVLKALRPLSRLPFEAHLMIEDVDSHLEAFAHAGADIILIHPESGVHLHRSLQRIKALGKKAGVVLNPSTSTNVLTYVLDCIDQVLIMTVNPGFAGQQFITNQLLKIQNVRELIQKRPIDIAVDGGITPETAIQVVASGANVLVAGTAIFQGGNLKSNISALRKVLNPNATT